MIFQCLLKYWLLPIQVIHKNKTNSCLPKYTSLDNFEIMFIENHWANTEKFSFSSHFKNASQAKAYLDEQMGLVVIDNFKGQYN